MRGKRKFFLPDNAVHRSDADGGQLFANAADYPTKRFA